MSHDPNENVRYPLTWPFWMSEKVAEAANERAMTVATWLRVAILEKLERSGKPRFPPTHEIIHKDGDPGNYDPANLEIRRQQP